MIDGEADGIVREVIDMAKGGDKVALRIVNLGPLCESAAQRHSLTEAFESEERTGVWFEEERVCGRPRAEIDQRTTLRPDDRSDPGLVSVRGPDWPGSHHDTKG
jgi:hypothetical protein